MSQCRCCAGRVLQRDRIVPTTLDFVQAHGFCSLCPCQVVPSVVSEEGDEGRLLRCLPLVAGIAAGGCCPVPCTEGDSVFAGSRFTRESWSAPENTGLAVLDVGDDRVQATSSRSFQAEHCSAECVHRCCSSRVELSRPSSPTSSVALVFGCGEFERVCMRKHTHRRRTTMRLCIDTPADLAEPLRHCVGATCSRFFPPLLMECLAMHLSALLAVALQGRQWMNQLSD